MRHFRLVLDAAQKLLGEASGARLEEAEKLVSPLQKLAHRDEHKAKVRGSCSLIRTSSLYPPHCFLLGVAWSCRPGGPHAGALQHQHGEALWVTAPHCSSDCVRHPSPKQI